MTIRFGTDGWRAKMGHDFTFANVRRACQGYANFLKKSFRGREIGVLVNHDTRYLSREFATAAAAVLSLNRIKAFRPDHDAPMPAAALAIVQNQLQGGIAFTASYNELIYNGIKLLDARGSPLLPSKTVLVEEEIAKLDGSHSFPPRYADERLLTPVEVKLPYLEYVSGMIEFGKIRESGLRIVVDNLYGSSRDYLDKLFLDHDIPITAIHNYSDAHFGGVLPSCSRENLRELASLILEKKADVGLATDIDGDRFGIIDGEGNFIDANTIIPPLIDYLITVRKLAGDIVKSVSSTIQIDRVARHYQRKVYETPVGFKFLADMLQTRKAFIGVESSNGAALKGATTCKDGILFGLLVTEMMAHYRAPLPRILADFSNRFPRLYGGEAEMRTTPRRYANYKKLLEKKRLPGARNMPAAVSSIDGVKFIFADAWLLIRESGTAPALKIYAESPAAAETRALIAAGRRLLEQG